MIGEEQKKPWLAVLSRPKLAVSWLNGSRLNSEPAQWESAKMAAQQPAARLS